MFFLTIQFTCFSRFSSINGKAQQQEFEMNFEPIDMIDAKCQAFNNSEGIMFLNYTVGDLPFFIETKFQYFSDRNITVTIKNVNNDTYNKIILLSRLSYQVNILGQLNFPGSFYVISNTQQNLSNCWQNMGLSYKRNGDDSYISVFGTPNFCVIPLPEVQFQFLTGNVWNSIEIKPNDTTNILYKGFQVPYIHIFTMFYQVFNNNLNSSQQQVFSLFYQEFTKNRNIQMRLHLSFQLEDTDLTTTIVQPLTEIESDTNKCLKSLNITTVTNQNKISNMGNLQNLVDCELESTQLTLISVFNQNQLYINSSQQYLAEVFAISFQFPNTDTELLLSNTTLFQQLFLLVLDENNQIIHEETINTQVIKSCFSQILVVVNKRFTQLVMFPVQTDICVQLYENKFNTSIEQIIMHDTPISYNSFLTTIKLENNSFFRVNLNQNHELSNSTYPMTSGSFRQRQKKLIRNYHKLQEQTIIRSEIDFWEIPDVNIEDVGGILAKSVGVAVGVAVCVVVGIAIGGRGQQ